MGSIIDAIVRVLKSLTQVFALHSLKGRIEAVEGAGDALALKLDQQADARYAEIKDLLGGHAERIAYLEGKAGLRE